MTRYRDLGLTVGQLPPGPLNAITDVEGVAVGMTTLIDGEGPLVVGQGPVRTGVTVIVPHPGIGAEPVYAGCHRLNGNGELTGLERTRHVGTYRDEAVDLSVNPRGGVLVGTADEQTASRLGLPRVDKAWWETEVSPDDPALVITEVHEPVGAGAPAKAQDVDRYFARFDADRVPQALLRRHFTAAGSVLLFGGGMKRGYVHGITADERPCRTVKDPVSITDLHATLYRAMGIPATHAYDVEKRPFYVTNDGKGKAVQALFA